VEDWESIYNSPSFWHFRFNGSTPEALVKGRENIYFSYFWNDLAADRNRSISKSDRKAYLAAYSRPGRMRAAWEYFVSWPQAAQDFAQMSQTKLTMPVLSIGGDKSLGEPLGTQMKLVAKDVKVEIVKNSGHWILEEQPKQTEAAILSFL
jgi:pimeloyl-ACP methyl ester carboxylesterase